MHQNSPIVFAEMYLLIETPERPNSLFRLLLQDLRKTKGLDVAINYQMRPVEMLSRYAGALISRDESVYDVNLFRDGRIECDCGDWLYRKSREGGDCKHIGALRKVKLLPEKQ